MTAPKKPRAQRIGCLSFYTDEDGDLIANGPAAGIIIANSAGVKHARQAAKLLVRWADWREARLRVRK